MSRLKNKILAILLILNCSFTITLYIKIDSYKVDIENIIQECFKLGQESVVLELIE